MALKFCLPAILFGYKILSRIMIEVDIQHFRQTLGANMKKARIMAGYTQKQVALWVGVTQASIAMYEAGKNSVPVDIVMWYALNFQVSPDDLFGYSTTVMGRELKDNLLLDAVYDDFDDPNSDLGKLLKAKIEEVLSERDKTGKK